MSQIVAMPRVQRRWAGFWESKLEQYQPVAYALGRAPPDKVEHLMSVGAATPDKLRLFAFASRADLEAFLAAYPDARECKQSS